MLFTTCIRRRSRVSPVRKKITSVDNQLTITTAMTVNLTTVGRRTSKSMCCERVQPAGKTAAETMTNQVTMIVIVVVSAGALGLRVDPPISDGPLSTDKIQVEVLP